MRKKKRVSLSERQRIEKGAWRVEKIVPSLYTKYQGTPNLVVIPKISYGTGVDILVYEGVNNTVLEVHEVTNWKRYTKNGALMRMIPSRFQEILNNLTRRVYKVYGLKGQIRVYTTPNTKRFLHVSYIDCLNPFQIAQLKQHGIEIIEWKREERLLGYIVESKRKDNKITRWYYKEDGTCIGKRTIKFK